jgi:23S rRNA-/tRNA-specific pseudouridylate synthase
VKRFSVVVVASRDTVLGDVLSRLGDSAEQALGEGRIFVGPRRAADRADRVAAGDEVAMHPARETSGGAPHVLFRGQGIVAAFKPAGMATVPDQRGSAGTLVDAIAKLAGLPCDRLSVTSRLDVGVSGVVLFATDDASRSRLSGARLEGRYRRHYVAVAARAPVPHRGIWDTPIGRDRDPRKRRAHGRDAVAAASAYAVCAVAERGALLAVEPKTGRTHQIRVHAAHAGCPLYGDATYGGPTRTTSATGAVTAIGRVALHAAWVEVPGAGADTLRVEAEIPEDLAAIWTGSGGDPGAWPRALEPLVSE